MKRHDWETILAAGACLLIAEVLVLKGLGSLVLTAGRAAMGKV